MMRILLAATFVAFAACVPDAPARPSFQLDVLPILGANCVRCHGAPTLGGAPEDLRLDGFDDAILREGVQHDPPELEDPCGDAGDPAKEFVLCGAATSADVVVLRIRDTAYPMPPRFPLDDYQIEVLENWARQPERGEPRAQNRAPTIETIDVVHVEATTTRPAYVRISVAIDDTDGDIVSAMLHARLDAPGSARTVVGPASSGHARVEWDTSSLAPGTYRLTATLDDGAAPVEVAMGTITLEAP